LNCNKIKNLGVTKEDIVAALKNSTMLELNADETKLRRIGNKPIPELKLLAKKRKPEQELDEVAIDEEKKLDS
jgi:hypothetical protein